jgi:hypothetical protein
MKEHIHIPPKTNNDNPIHDERCAGAQDYDDFCMTCWEGFCEDAMASQEAEIEAEFRMSWVMGGGSPSDASQAWNMHREAYMRGDIG